MSMIAATFPIVPGKTEAWRRWLAEIQPGGAHRAAFVASRRGAGVRERTYLQQTPMGDFVVVTLEGQDAEGAFDRMVHVQDEFTKWFVSGVTDLHGVDLGKMPPGAPSVLVTDSEG
jgi:hypothetical protein